MDSLLKVKNLSKSFGGLLALNEITLEVEPERIVGIIGPNGAGKTTFFNCLSCLYHPTGGLIEFKNIPLATPTSTVAKKRIRIFALIFLILGLIRLPLFWSFFLSQTFFKVELFLLGLFVFSIRFLLVRDSCAMKSGHGGSCLFFSCPISVFFFGFSPARTQAMC